MKQRIGLLGLRQPLKLARKGYLRLLALFSRRHAAAVLMDSLDEKLARFDSEIAESQERHQKVLQEINNELNKLAGDVAMLNLQTATFSLGLRVSLVASAIEKLERLDKIQLCLAKISPIMDKLIGGLFNGLPISFYEHVLDTQDSITTHEITKAIIKFCNDDDARRLRERIQSWHVAAFIPRKKFFDEALWAHRNGKYNLSVSVLISQVEGIVRDSVKTKYAFTHRSFAQVRAVFSRRFSVLSELLTETSATVEEVHAIMNYYNLQKLESLYDAYAPEAHQDPGGLLRHAVAHGLWLDYGKVEQSTRLFLLLDMLHSMLKQLETPHSFDT